MANDSTKSNNTGAYYASTVDDVIRDDTEQYLNSIDVDNPPTPAEIRCELLRCIRNDVALYNSIAQGGCKMRYPRMLSEAQIASILLHLNHIVNIDFSGNMDDDSDTNVIAIYDKEKGIYSTKRKTFYKMISEYRYDLKDKDFNEIIKMLERRAPVVKPCSNRDIVIVNNGIFNYKTKQLEPFSPDYIFTSKTSVDYNPYAQNVVIHNDEDNTDWDIESWVDSLSDDPDIVRLLWQVIGAVVRPYNAWDKVVLLACETGSNGKGTLIELLRQLCGDGNWASIPIGDFSKEFSLEPLISVNAVLVDENDTNTYLDKCGLFKACVTGDAITINRKFKSPISYRSHVFMVQCMNSVIRVKDKSDSFYRRLLPIPMTKRFYGRERKYIKHDYLKRKDVLEYTLYKVLNMNYYQLSVPKASEELLGIYKVENDTIRQFVEQFFGDNLFKWDLLPFNFLYDLYKAWFKRNNPTGLIESAIKFNNELIRIVNENDFDFYCEDKSKQYRPYNRMDEPECLIYDYDLVDWKNLQYKGDDINKICHPTLKVHYRGLLRKVRGNVQLQNDVSERNDYYED